MAVENSSAEAIRWAPVVIPVPIRWEMALDEFAAGKTLPQYLGKTYHEVFEKCRREECDRFRSEVSERDYEWYLRAV